jgi:hypothetical protein
MIIFLAQVRSPDVNPMSQIKINEMMNTPKAIPNDVK